MKIENPEFLEEFKVDASDRKFQIWERNALSVDIFSREVLEQKLDYIHANPVEGKWNLASEAVDYKYSSMAFYENEDLDWPFLKRYDGEF